MNNLEHIKSEECRIVLPIGESALHTWQKNEWIAQRIASYGKTGAAGSWRKLQQITRPD